MKLVVLCCLVATAFAAPASPTFNQDDVKILKYENDASEKGFNYFFEQSDGTKNQAEGIVKGTGEDAFVAIKGLYSFIIDGIPYTITYTADEDGYQPTIEQGPGGAVPPGVVASLLG